MSGADEGSAATVKVNAATALQETIRVCRLQRDDARTHRHREEVRHRGRVMDYTDGLI